MKAKTFFTIIVVFLSPELFAHGNEDHSSGSAASKSLQTECSPDINNYCYNDRDKKLCLLINRAKIQTRCKTFLQTSDSASFQSAEGPEQNGTATN